MHCHILYFESAPLGTHFVVHVSKPPDALNKQNARDLIWVTLPQGRILLLVKEKGVVWQQIGGKICVV